jgi:hypothetical protein
MNIRKTLRTLSLTAIPAALAMAATPASAALVDNGDGTVTVNGATSGGTAILDFDGNVGGQFIPGLTGELQLTFAGVVGGDYTFTYVLLNTSTITSRLSGFAFDTNPNITGGTATGLFTNLLTNGNYPNGVGSVEVCLNSGGNACAGGGNGGVWNGNQGSGAFTLDFGNSTPGTITLSDFFDRYQSLDLRQGGSGTGSYVPPGVPEPGTWAMMLLGFGAAGVSVRRSRRKKTLVSQLA